MKHPKKLPYVKVYDGYGHSENIVVYGHVFKKKPHFSAGFLKNGLLTNLWHLLRLFKVKPIAYASVELVFQDQKISSTTAFDGFFKLELVPESHLSAGWHSIMVHCLDDARNIISTGEGKVFVPHLSQYAFISDIDDTIIQSFSAKTFKRLYELISRNPAKRRLFDETAKHYSLLANSFVEDELPNPFFYVSSSEWNLYEYLGYVFKNHHLPTGIFLLNQIKRWQELATTGKTGHDGKFFRIVRILKAFPKQQFVLLGDNSQKDPAIYAKIAALYQEQIVAIYIRNVRPSKVEQTEKLLLPYNKNNIAVCLFKNSKAAIEHGLEIGLIDRKLLS